MTIKEVVQAGCPVQVMFYDGEGMCSGIMFGDKIICGCCGAVLEVEDVIDNAKIDGVEYAIRMFKTWVDLSDEIRGDENYFESDSVVLEMEDNNV